MGSYILNPENTNRDIVPGIDLDMVCISMKHRQKFHFKTLQEALGKEKLKLHLFEGINGKELNVNDYPLTDKYRSWFIRKEEERKNHITENDYRGHLGCTLSHLTILKNIQHMTIIWEDDAEPIPPFRARLVKALMSVPLVDANWEVLVLGFSCKYQDHYYCKNNDTEPIYEGGIIRLHFWFGGWCYCIRSPEVAQKLVKLLTPINWHIDLSIAELARKGQIRAYGVMPTMAHHAGPFKVSSFDYWQYGDRRLIRSDTTR